MVSITITEKCYVQRFAISSVLSIIIAHVVTLKVSIKLYTIAIIKQFEFLHSSKVALSEH